MKLTRRWFQYSLRSFLVLMMALAIWLGVVVNRAHRQQISVETIEAAGGVVVYDWQPMLTSKRKLEQLTKKKVEFLPERPILKGPAWLRRLIGHDYFQEIKEVYLLPSASQIDQEVSMLMPYLEGLQGLRYLVVSSPLSKATQTELEAKLPNCEVYIFDIDRRH